MLSLMILAAGCVENDVTTVDDDPVNSDTEAPGVYVYDDDGEVIEVDLDHVTLALEDAADQLLVVDPNLWIQAYTEAMAWEDTYCPYHYEDYLELYGYDYWYGGCSTESGGKYDGYGYGYQYTEPVDTGLYFYWTYGWLGGELGIEHPDGSRLDLAGYFYAQDYEIAANRYQYSQLAGSILWVGPEFEGTWLERGLSANLILSSGANDTTGTYLSIDGGLSGYDGESSAVWFDGVLMAQESRGHDCEVEPSGVISVRQSDGLWIDVVFDGANSIGGEVFPAACDGCGVAWVEGDQVGEVCPDLSVLTAWTGRPW